VFDVRLNALYGCVNRILSKENCLNLRVIDVYISITTFLTKLF
jgi:hypothetical protein